MNFLMTLLPFANASSGFYYGGGFGVTTLHYKAESFIDVTDRAKNSNPFFCAETGYRKIFANRFFFDLGLYLSYENSSIDNIRLTDKEGKTYLNATDFCGNPINFQWNVKGKVKTKTFGGLKAKIGKYLSDKVCLYSLGGFDLTKISFQYEGFSFRRGLEETYPIADKFTKTALCPYLGIGTEFTPLKNKNLKFFLEFHYVFNKGLNFGEKAGIDSFMSNANKAVGKELQNTGINKVRFVSGLRCFL